MLWEYGLESLGEQELLLKESVIRVWRFGPVFVQATKKGHKPTKYRLIASWLHTQTLRLRPYPLNYEGNWLYWKSIQKQEVFKQKQELPKTQQWCIKQVDIKQALHQSRWEISLKGAEFIAGVK